MPYRRRKNTKHNNAKRLRKLETLVRPEVKFRQFESGAFDTIGSTSGTLLLPQKLSEGVGRNQRVGDKVKSKNIRFNAIVQLSPSAVIVSASAAVRILVLRSKFSDPTTSVLTPLNTWYGNVDEDKYFVMKDILTQVHVTGDSDNLGSTFKRIKLNIPTGLRKLQYDGAAENSPLNNEVLIYMIASSTSAVLAYNMTHYYIDN